MPEELKRKDERRLEPRQVVLFVALWIVSALLSVVDWLSMRAAFTAVVAVIVGSVPVEWQIERQWYLRWTARAADPCAVAVLTMLVFLSMIGFDFLYRDAIWKGRAGKTFAVVTGIQVGIAALSWLAITLAERFA